MSIRANWCQPGLPKTYPSRHLQRKMSQIVFSEGQKNTPFHHWNWRHPHFSAPIFLPGWLCVSGLRRKAKPGAPNLLWGRKIAAEKSRQVDRPVCQINTTSRDLERAQLTIEVRVRFHETSLVRREVLLGFSMLCLCFLYPCSIRR